MYKLEFYTPKSHVETIKKALFAAGAGAFSHYDQCSWEVLGQGQFRALEASDPYIGKKNELSYSQELKVEMLIPKSLAKKMIQILKNEHPYEQPAYFLLPCIDESTLSD